MNGYYEHHLKIKKDKLCPFIVRYTDNSNYSTCNWHKNIELLLVTDGNGRIQYGKDMHKISTSDTVIISSGVLHQLFSDTTTFKYILMIIDEDFCKENGLDTSIFRFDKIIRDEDTERLIRNAYERMKDYSAYNEPLAAARLRSAILSVLINICSRHATRDTETTAKSTPSEQYVKRAIEYLNNNYSSLITLDELASICGITKYHLAREFKKYTGQTILTYTNILRCKKAEIMLSDGKNVTEVAFECGFESLSYFSRTYKKMMGISPSKSRKN